MIQLIQCDQGSPEWFAARKGIPTASEFHQILTPPKSRGGEAKTRRTYMHKLAAEILTGELTERVSTPDMERGKAWEDEARDAYCFVSGEMCQRVGFVRNGDVGASPDSLIDDIGGLEIKTAKNHIQIDRLLKDELPDEHKAQVQGNLWICERDWWDFCSYCPKLPPFIKRIYRDDGFIANLAGAIRQFNDELAETVEKIRRYGDPKPTVKEQLVASVREIGMAEYLTA